ncbi:acetyl-CoA C-acetyltransferase [Peredibacter sp. HCB2-198]|uniref:acetyl-CoA C-acetyltransferase n=1 Tax=Peredibacter sp. HCB2-198 TaxID=3383025 RepID=UPI0038B42238
MRKVAILGGSRTPFVKSMTSYQGLSNQTMLTAVMNDLVNKTNLKGKLLGDVIAGTVMNHPFDYNLTREVVLGTELDPRTPGLNIQRACGTGLEAANLVFLKVATGQMDSGIAGGSDTNSDIPFVGQRRLTHFMIKLQNAKTLTDKLKILSSFNPKMLKPEIPVVKEPRTGLSMGEHAELMVKEWGITREAQDQLALESHQKAAKAYEEGFYDDLIINFQGLKKDAFTRKDTSIEKLAKLKPAFDFSGKGSLTAGNSTPLTDGASAVLMGSEDFARENNLEVMAYFKDAEVAAVDFVHGEGLLMGPTIAVSRLLERNNLTLQDFDFYEIHEAFAGQVLCTLKAWEDPEYCKRVLNRDKAMGSIDRNKMNVKGGSLAVGHPFAATGGRIVAAAGKILKEAGKGRLLVSVCTAGGMGVAAIIER